MKILVTGSSGFIGKNLISQLRNRGYDDILTYDFDTLPELLNQYVSECEFVFHLAGVNRPEHPDRFMEGNRDFTKKLLDGLECAGNRATVLASSSIQAERSNPYGISKREGEKLLFAFHERTGANVLIYRLPNVYGKWCRPNYNSVVATFCYNIARDLPVRVDDAETVLRLVYIDDVVDEFIRAMKGESYQQNEFCEVEDVSSAKLGQIVDLLCSFRNSRKTLQLPDFSDSFQKKLYSTYLSYLPKNDFAYSLTTHSDSRGGFAEVIHTPERGQFSINISKPGITKGNHWHRTKNEKFLVTNGDALIRLRDIYGTEIVEYAVSGEELRVIDIPPGYTHSIVNVGSGNLVTVIWANECFDSDNPDTYYLEV